MRSIRQDKPINQQKEAQNGFFLLFFLQMIKLTAESDISIRFLLMKQFS